VRRARTCQERCSGRPSISTVIDQTGRPAGVGVLSDVPVATAQLLQELLAMRKPGDTVQITVIRSPGETKTVTVRLGELPAS
jgi:S1-C subfamily serine protease